MGKYGEKIVNFVKANDTNIITGIGIADGLALGGYLWYKTGVKVSNKIHYEEEFQMRELTFKEKIKATWKMFILPTVNTLVSGGLLIYSARIGNKRLAALGAAYNIAETTIQKYADKAKEVVGEKKAEAISQKVAEDNFNNSKNEIATTYHGDLIVQEPATGIKFNTTWDKVDLAIMKVQREAEQGNGVVTLSSFFRELGLTPTDATDMLGWDVNRNGSIYISKVAILDSEGEPCGALDYHGDLIAL